jgi:hypothetical protein
MCRPVPSCQCSWRSVTTQLVCRLRPELRLIHLPDLCAQPARATGSCTSQFLPLMCIKTATRLPPFKAALESLIGHLRPLIEHHTLIAALANLAVSLLLFSPSLQSFLLFIAAMHQICKARARTLKSIKLSQVHSQNPRMSFGSPYMHFVFSISLLQLPHQTKYTSLVCGTNLILNQFDLQTCCFNYDRADGLCDTTWLIHVFYDFQQNWQATSQFESVRFWT